MIKASFALFLILLLFEVGFCDEWCPLFQLEKRQIIKVIWNFDEARAIVQAGDAFGVISPFFKRALINDEIIPLKDFPKFVNGDLWVERGFLERMGLAKEAFELCQVDLPSKRAGWGLAISRIVLDPGHGGKDTGVLINETLMEKELALEFAKRLKAQLEGRGFWVELTREDDKFLSLAERIEVAIQAKADLFLSLHFNGWEDEKARGFEVYYPSFIPTDVKVEKLVEKENLSFSEETKSTSDFLQVYWRFKKEQEIHLSAMLARLIEKSVRKSLNDVVILRGVNGAPFFVLVRSPVPAVLIEFGYLTNPEDVKLLMDEKYRDSILNAIAEAVCAYDIALWIQMGGKRWQGRTAEEPIN